MVKNPLANAGYAGEVCLIPGSRRSLGEGNGNPLQYSYLENYMYRGVWRAAVHGLTKSNTRMNNFHSTPVLKIGETKFGKFSCHE